MSFSPLSVANAVDKPTQYRSNELETGSICKIVNLKKRPDLNGKVVELNRRIGQRWTVKLNDGKEIALKQSNLKKIKGGVEEELGNEAEIQDLQERFCTDQIEASLAYLPHRNVSIVQQGTLGNGLVARRPIAKGDLITGYLVMATMGGEKCVFPFPQNFSVSSQMANDQKKLISARRMSDTQTNIDIVSELSVTSMYAGDSLANPTVVRFSNLFNLMGQYANDIGYTKGEPYVPERNNAKISTINRVYKDRPPLHWVVLQATKDIEKGNFVTVAYGKDFWDRIALAPSKKA